MNSHVAGTPLLQTFEKVVIFASAHSGWTIFGSSGLHMSMSCCFVHLCSGCWLAKSFNTAAQILRLLVSPP